MRDGFRPLDESTCMKCRKAPSRYYGKWGAEGLCRACVQRMPGTVRRKVLRDMHGPDRKRWQLDDLLDRAAPGPKRSRTARAPAPSPRPRPAPAKPPTASGQTASPPSPQERRRHRRVYAELPASFSLFPGSNRSGQLEGRVFRAVTKDLSRGGARLIVADPALFGLPFGCRLRLSIRVPGLPAGLRCVGVLRNVVKNRRGKDLGYLCLAFEALGVEGSRELQRFLSPCSRSARRDRGDSSG
ncbi:MAG: hypothetical protein Kow0092_05550 [Deferrisomatales bacterium]